MGCIRIFGACGIWMLLGPRILIKHTRSPHSYTYSHTQAPLRLRTVRAELGKVPQVEHEGSFPGARAGHADEWRGERSPRGRAAWGQLCTPCLPGRIILQHFIHHMLTDPRRCVLEWGRGRGWQGLSGRGTPWPLLTRPTASPRAAIIRQIPRRRPSLNQS